MEIGDTILYIFFIPKNYRTEEQMIKPEEIKDQNFKIFLGMPMYGGMLTESTLHGLLELQSWTQANNVAMRIQTMGNESLITRARNTIDSMMMYQTALAATDI